MQEVYPDIFLITEKGKFGTITPNANIYVLAGENGLIFDSGYGTKQGINHFLKEIKEIEAIFKSRGQDFHITQILPSHGHPDHISGLGSLRKHLNLRIITTSETANIIKNKNNFLKSFKSSISKFKSKLEDNRNEKKIPLKIRFMYLLLRNAYGISFIDNPDEIIPNDGEILINNESWKIFPSPGHSFDHISLYNEEKGILFSGDNILNGMTTWLGPPNSNLEHYINSLDNASKLINLKYIFPAHGKTIINNPKEKILEIKKLREMKIKRIFELIKDNSELGLSIEELIDKLYVNGSKRKKSIARGGAWLTLKMLENKNLLKSIKRNKKIKFFLGENYESYSRLM